ncbi:protein FAM26E-like [Sinocyclocheilus grahami]|uniref:protein FAM26E-like n=1 Tax=Sinocyclocheilus grahami TaxID=75366 RepID=UPI0007ACAF3D|nr:PREDICTED: protein FAM26E-like [Sinocyclocheilus grahami]
MSLLQKQREILETFAAFGSVTLSVLLFGFMVVINHTFTCPCRSDQNTTLTVSIFIGPAFFALVIMFHMLRPLRYGWFHCPKGAYDDNQQNWPKALISCLIPPVMWIFMLLLDGDYVACAMTKWNGVYVSNFYQNMSWCKPIEGLRNVTELQDLTRKYIHQSQYAGYVVISVFSALSLAVVGIHDCCISGKCDRCPSRLLLFCGQIERHSEENDQGQDDVELCPTSTISTHPLVVISKRE